MPDIIWCWQFQISCCIASLRATNHISATMFININGYAYFILYVNLLIYLHRQVLRQIVFLRYGHSKIKGPMKININDDFVTQQSSISSLSKTHFSFQWALSHLPAAWNGPILANWNQFKNVFLRECLLIKQS